MMHLNSVFYINMNEFNDKQSVFINKVYCICLNCLVALNTKFTKRANFQLNYARKLSLRHVVFILVMISSCLK